MLTTTMGKVTRHYFSDADWIHAITNRHKYLHCTFGRMNPPTDAHLDILQEMTHAVNPCDYNGMVFLSATQNIKNPLPFERRQEIVWNIFPELVVKSATDLFDAYDQAESAAKFGGFEGIVWYVGTDRLDAASRLWLYPDRWTTPLRYISEYARAEHDSVSATAVRAAALNSDYDTYERMAADSSPEAFEELRTLLTNGSLESKTKTAK